MAKKKSFLKGDKSKRMMTKGVSALARSGSAVAAAYISNKLVGEKFPDIKKYQGPVLFLGATIAEMFVDNPYASAALQGVATVGALQSVKLISPTLGTDMGLSGDEDWAELEGLFDEYEDLSGGDDTPGWADDLAGDPEFLPQGGSVFGDVILTPEEIAMADQI